MKRPEPRRARREAAGVVWRRRYAAYGCMPRECGCPHAFHADPLDCLAAPPAPSTFSLDARELAHHADRLAAAGWQGWELRQRLDLAAVAAA